ncbi:MAG: glycosyltransferase family 4 protein [Bryobacteraceae bacterium]
MRVVIDGTPLTVPTGGVARYTAELSRALAGCFPEDEFRLVSDQPFPMPAQAANLKQGSRPGRWFERRWWSCGLPRELMRSRADVFHGTDFSVPYIPVRPSVMTLHDLSPWLDPSWHRDAARVRQRTPILLRLRLATMVVTPSESVRRAAIERFRILPDRIVSIPLAAAETFRPVGGRAAEVPYFLYVGTLEPRKNIPLLIEAWREVRRRCPVDLVLAGRRRADFPMPASEPGLRVLRAVPDEELPALYSGAVAVLYPSFYEGFGLPVLEAMQCGAPVLASRDAAIAEVAGGAALLLPVDEAWPWVEAMEKLLRQPERTEEMRGRGLARAQGFRWAKTARATREVYFEAVARFRRRFL